MIARFVLGGCRNVKDKEKRKSIHVIPFYDDPRPMLHSGLVPEVIQTGSGNINYYKPLKKINTNRIIFKSKYRSIQRNLAKAET